MEFQRIIDNPAREIDLVIRLAEKLKARFGHHQNVNYVLWLEKYDVSLSHITSIKLFSDRKSFDRYYYSLGDDRFQTGITICFRRGCYIIEVFGFTLSAKVEVHPNKIDFLELKDSTATDDDADSTPLSEREIEEGRADLMQFLGEIKNPEAPRFIDFQQFLNKPAREIDLLKRLAIALHAEYDRHEDRFYFLKTEKAGGELVRVVSVNAFNSHKAYGNDQLAHPLIPPGFSVVFKEDRFRLICTGYFVHAYATVWPNKIEFDEIDMEISTVDPRLLIPDQPLILSGFRDLVGHFESISLASKKSGAA